VKVLIIPEDPTLDAYIPQVAELISRGFQCHVFYEYPETSTAVDKRAG
jgi:hypothetical protein